MLISQRSCDSHKLERSWTSWFYAAQAQETLLFPLLGASTPRQFTGISARTFLKVVLQQK